MAPANRTICNFLFLGPTGTGKTRIVESLAECLAGNARAVIKIDCAEFQNSHEVAKLIGSPPGYLGHRETAARLSQSVINAHRTEKCRISFVLFDEIEKASDALWNILLGILDKATLTLGDNSRVNFEACMIFMTSNLGAREIEDQVSSRFGFSGASESRGGVRSIAETAARRKFTPEFMNRIDRIVTFSPLTEENLRRILDIELRAVQDRLFSRASLDSFVLTLSLSAKDLLLRLGYDRRYGARYLKRTIERLVVQPISNLIATEQARGGDWIFGDAYGDSIRFSRRAAGLSAPELLKLSAEA